MKIILITFVTLTFFSNGAFGTDEVADKLDCSDFNSLFVGSIFNLFSSSNVTDKVGTKFYLATRRHSNATKIGSKNWTNLELSGFNPGIKTYLIIHGYQNHIGKKWVINLKDKLLEARDVNVILIDWRKGANKWNYVNTVRSTLIVRKEIYNLFEQMKAAVDNFKDKPSTVLWNHLYFIGHSLGAHISGQVSYLLKQDNFFKVERITALDPAQPCFKNAPLHLKIDKNDADFVDVLHSQTGTGETINGFGLKEPVGHTDIYINGGVMQPVCENSLNSAEMNKMICSHGIVCEYFIETIAASLNNDCKFTTYKWNQTYKDALRILSDREKNVMIPTCPEMGFNASKEKDTGVFLAITAAQPPFCQFTSNDVKTVKVSIKRLKKKPDFNTSFINLDYNQMTNVFNINDLFNS